MSRICITGGPKTGKTTMANRMSLGATADIRHTDDLIASHDWSAASLEVSTWLDAPGPWIIEGVAVSRALRKWRDAHPGEPPPVDRVIYMEQTYVRLNDGQDRMAKGVETVHREVERWLVQHGVRTERWRPSQYSTHIEVVT